jgi:hypothetical protein
MMTESPLRNLQAEKVSVEWCD